MEGDIFHIINRGVEKRKIFMDTADYLRFCNNLFDFNDKNEVDIPYYNRRKLDDLAIRKPKDELVDILCVCLMPNHFHLLVREKIDRGAGLFSKKITSGYTQSFNLKNKRAGVLFQGKTKIISIIRDEHFLYLPFYIFSNPIKLKEPKGKDGKINNFKNVKKFLENYKWFSFPKENEDEPIFEKIINEKEFFDTFQTNKKELRKDFYEWIKED